MKTVRVVAAVIKAVNENGEPIIFATQRGYGEFKDGWEFPGGKIEEGETPQDALKREIGEELDTEISVGELIDTIEYDYPAFHLSMDCFWCEIVKGDLVLKEHEAARWLNKKSKEIKDIIVSLKIESKWETLKKSGISALPSGDATQAFDELNEILKQAGIFIVPVLARLLRCIFVSRIFLQKRRSIHMQEWKI